MDLVEGFGKNETILILNRGWYGGSMIKRSKFIRSVNYLRVDERTSYLCSTSHAQSLISSRRCKGVLPPVGGLARRHEVISRVNHRERFKSPSEQKACILGYDLPIKIKRSPQFATKPLFWRHLGMLQFEYQTLIKVCWVRQGLRFKAYCCPGAKLRRNS